MDILQTNQKRLSSMEKACSVLFFLSLILNDSFGDVAGLNIFSKGTILLFMLCTALLILLRNIRVPAAFPILLILNLFWWICSCFWAPGSTMFISTLAQNVLFAFCVFCFFLQSKNYDLLFWAMFFSGFLLVLYSLSVYGLNDFIETLQDERIGTEITNANNYGRIFSYGILSGVYLAIYKNKRWCFAGCLVFLFFSLSSGSKKAILIILIGIIFLTFFRFGLRHPVKFLFGVVITVVALMLAIRLPIFSVMNERLVAFLQGEKDYGDMNRQGMIAKGLEMFREKPIVGWGMNAFATVSGYHVYSHNNFIEMLANYGVVGFGSFYSIYLYILGKFRHVFRYLLPSYLMMLSILLTILVTDYGIVSYGIKWNWMVIGTAAAMAVHGFRNCKKGENKNVKSVDQQI